MPEHRHRSRSPHPEPAPERLGIDSTPAPRPGSHPARRLRERGARALTDAELVALVTAQHDAAGTDRADALLRRHGGLRGLLEKGQERGGGSPAIRARLAACQELMRRYLRAPLERGESLVDPGATRRFVMAELGGRRQEVFACLYLDTRHRLLGFRELFHGTINGASVHPREVVRAALELNAAALIVAHNHPSGEPEPSAADRAITARLRQAVELIDVRLLDHLVVGATRSVSFAERGWL